MMSQKKSRTKKRDADNPVEAESKGGESEAAAESATQLDLAQIITDHLVSGLFLLDSAGRITFVNQTGEALTGCSREELLGEVFRDKLTDGALLKEAVTSRAAPTEREELLVRKNGEVVQVRCAVRPIQQKGSPARALVEIQDLSHEKQAEEHLRQEARRSEAILGSITEGFFSLDRDWRITYINRKAEQILQPLTNNPEHMLGKNLWEVFPQAVGSAFEEQYRRAMNEQTHVSVEEFYPPLARWFSVDAYPSPEGLSLFFRDVTDRRDAEEALQKETARKTGILDSALDAIISMDSEGRIVDFNAAAERIFGYSADEVTGKTVAETIIPERLRNRHWEGLQHFHSTGHGPLLGKRIEVPALRADGSEFPAELAIATTTGPGQPPFFTAYLRDITEAKQAEQALREAGERFRFMAESMPQKIFTASPAGNVDYFNRLWMDFTGLSFEEIRDWGWTRFVHPDDLAENKRLWKNALKTGEAFQVEHRFRRHDGVYRWHLSRCQAMRNENGEIVMWIGSNTDIDEQKRAKEKLEEMVAERTSELQETVGELEAFSYSISHDMRSPLRAMHSFATILEEECAEQVSDEGKDYIRRITTAADRMDRLIQDVLTYSRISRSKLPLTRVDVKTLLEDILESYPDLQPSRAEFILEEPLPPVLGNEAALTQCFSNLLGNAVKFVPPEVKPRVRVWAEEKGDRVRLFFADNGIGMEKGNHDKIFEIFNRLSRSYEGTGIGLAIVQKAVTRMDGKVGVESQPGKGSTFWLEFNAAGKGEP